METVTLTIDGRQLTVEKGKTVLQAAIEHGIKVPYYCYHPGLGIDGSCRVCLVKIEKMPKLQTACSTPAAEGMVVMTETPDVVEARASVFEFLLINHPLDCPVCDKGGECPLQDFSYSFGPNESRMEFPRRVFDGEGVKADVDFGPTLMLNRNRCILCTRCVRFMKEVDGDAQINITDRGYGSEIATFQEEGVHSLLSGNLMDVCPVGAITTRDYRFKSRPWDNPEAVDTICTFCEKGCNTSAWLKAKPEWAKGARLVRMTPRYNPAVNDYWMCDIGRFDYHWIEGDDRLRSALVRGAAGGQQPVEPREALAKIAERVDAVGGTGDAPVPDFGARLASRSCSCSAGSAARSACPKTAWRSAGGRATKPQPPGTKFRIPPVDAPNVKRRGGPRLPGPVAAASGEPDLSAFRRQVEGGARQGAVRLRPGPGRLDRRRLVGHRRAAVGQAAAAHRAGRADDRSGARRRRRPAGRLVAREGRRLRQPAGPAAGRGAGADGAGRRAGRLADLRQPRRWRSARRSTTPSSAHVRADVARALGRQPALRRAGRARLRAAGGGEALAAGV